MVKNRKACLYIHKYQFHQQNVAVTGILLFQIFDLAFPKIPDQTIFDDALSKTSVTIQHKEIGKS